jgi:flagellar biosynthesis protein FliP
MLLISIPVVLLHEDLLVHPVLHQTGIYMFGDTIHPSCVSLALSRHLFVLIAGYQDLCQYFLLIMLE